VVVAPGGVGTLLEFLYAWQLLQVKHISGVPLILLGNMWTDFMKWIRRHPLRKKFLDREDLDHLFLAGDYTEAFEIIKRFHDTYKDGDAHPNVDLKKYNVKRVKKKK
jgi:predicted Rossmann-fold nucleotide-binding protein